ncbi:hypothetical protein AGMMS49975_18910 [Clostridia bacterium]|nr:hypothetical protein AGMMS49975_18910 [Clostridia bacterium]
MAELRPFRAVRPNAEFAREVAALPYDVMNSDEARIEVSDKPNSFLHIDKSEVDLPIGTDLYAPEVYQKARENLYKMIEDKVFIQDDTPCFYIYKLTRNGRAQYGLVACASVDEYLNGTIKKHELTLEKKEQDRIRHVETLNAQTGPIFLAYREKDEIDALVSKWTKEHTPVYDFASEDGISHTVWVVDDSATVSEIAALFEKVPCLYIADGHHRNASAVKVALKKRGQLGDDKNAEYNGYLSVIFPANQLEILDYNRVVKDLNGLSEPEFIEKIKQNFIVTETDGQAKPQKRHTFGMYISKKWYLLELKPSVADENDVIASLDVSVMQKYILSDILGIDDPRTDKRVDFVGGIRGLDELERRTRHDCVLAFAMFPTSMTELMNIADDNKIMPPKSTWFEPKLRSGLFVHLLV